MVVLVNGKLVPEEQAVVSVFDRGFLYGDGLFETVPIYHKRPFRWEQHLERLWRGLEFLQLRLPFARENLGDFLEQLLAANQLADAILRITVSRGTGPRGYSPKGAEQPVLVLALHSAAPFSLAQIPQWRLITASVRLPAGERLAQFKTCNKLPQILARAEAEAANAQEALLLNTDGFIVEAAGSNLFWCKDGGVATAPLTTGILPGVTRQVLAELCARLSVPWTETAITREQILHASGVFLSLSTVGMAEAVSLDETLLARSPTTARLREAYVDLLRTETGWAGGS